MMGGDVTVTSEPGKGSVFTVRLPCGADLTLQSTHTNDLVRFLVTDRAMEAWYHLHE
jgi:hypothetical protein